VVLGPVTFMRMTITRRCHGSIRICAGEAGEAGENGKALR
jgi:hypothetical protein